jgi:hypothetical protein
MKRASVWALLIVGCGGASAPGTSSGDDQNASGGEGVVVIEENDDNRISRSAGEEGGVVVLWPRVMGLPDTEPTRAQAHLVEIARQVFPDRQLDIRPEPERVCPRDGCHTVSLGLLLVANNGGCATVAIIGRPGTTNLTLVPWTGRIELRDRTIPFREPPESHIVLHDSGVCADLEQDFAAHDEDVARELRNAG